MIAAWMAYILVVSTLIAGAAWVTERISRRAGTPTRWTWGLAMLVILAWPALSLLRDGNDSAAVGTAVVGPSTAVDPALLDMLKPIAERAGTFDPVLLWLWLAVSGASCCLLMWTDRRTRRLVRRLPTITISGVAVRLSHDLGPAVIGWPAGAIVLPRWTEELAEPERDLIIAHEFHHQRARDALLLGASALAVALVPWNLPMWWIARRLRAAVEFDCDARVLRDGTAPATYAAMLCAIAGRPHRPLAAALAISHPTSLLARRIDHMLKPVVRTHPALLALAGVAAGGFLIAACEVPTPPTDPATATATYRVTELPGASAIHVTPGSDKEDYAAAELELHEVYQRIELLRARGASDEASDMREELTKLEQRARETRTRMQATAGGVYRMPSVVRERPVTAKFEALQKEAEEIARAARRPSTDGGSFGGIVRLREQAQGGADARAGVSASPLWYVDNEPVSGPAGLTPDRIAKIEVIKGVKAREMFGDHAAGGVIQIFTKASSN